MKNIVYLVLVFISFNDINGQDNTNNQSKGEELMADAYEMYLAGKIDSSIYIYKQAAIELEKQNDKKSLIETYANLYAINHYVDNHNAADEIMLKTEALFLKYFSKEDENYSEIANSIGVFYKSRGDYTTALEYYKKAFIPNNMSRELKARLLDSIAGILTLQGDISEAIKTCKNGIDLLFPLTNKTKKTLPNLYRNLAYMYKDINDLDSTKHYLLKSRHLIKQLDFSNDVSLKKNLIYSLTDLTQIAIEENKLLLTEKYIKEWESIYSNKYSFRRYQLYLKKALFFEKRNDNKKSLLYLNKSKQVTKENYSIYRKHPVLGKPYYVTAKFYQNSKQYIKALEELQAGLKLISITQEEKKKDSFIHKKQGIDFLTLKAELETQIFAETNDIKYLKDCNKTYETLSNLILKMRTDIQSQASELNWSQRLTKIYQSAVKNAVTLYQKTNDKSYLEQAFYYSECNKAATLAEKVSYEKTLKSILPEEKWKALQDLRIDIAFYQKQINSAQQKTEQDATKIDEWTQIIEGLEDEYETLEKGIKENYPEYANAVKTFKPSTVEDIRNGFLKDNTALIEYFSTEDSWYIFTLTKDDLKVEEMKREESFDVAFDGLIKQISLQPNSSTYVQGLSDFTNNSQALYEFLLKKSLKNLAEEVNSLMIIPDGKLTYFPFELLLSEKPKQNTASYSASAMPYLFNDYNISYGFSATVVNLTHKNTKHTNTGMPAIFAPTFSNEYIAENRSCQEDNLSYLQCNTTEGERINKLISGDIFTGDLASIQQFREVVSNSPILHLATHACVDEESTDGNKIFFADTYLTNEDLNTLGVNADLVVLSACDTGLGKLIKGEGLMSLSRGFLCAGAASTLMSLWSVDDCATSDLMVNFYQELKDGHNKSIALKNAKLNYLSQADKLHQHPYFWAPFVLSGNVEPIESVVASSSFLYLGIGALAFLFLMLFGYWKTRA